MCPGRGRRAAAGRPGQRRSCGQDARRCGAPDRLRSAAVDGHPRHGADDDPRQGAGDAGQRPGADHAGRRWDGTVAGHHRHAADDGHHPHAADDGHHPHAADDGHHPHAADDDLPRPASATAGPTGRARASHRRSSCATGGRRRPPPASCATGGRRKTEACQSRQCHRGTAPCRLPGACPSPGRRSRSPATGACARQACGRDGIQALGCRPTRLLVLCVVLRVSRRPRAASSTTEGFETAASGLLNHRRFRDGRGRPPQPPKCGGKDR